MDFVFPASINCLHADGAQFAHPLQHLGKSQADLPLLAIDSFRHMFLFPDINDISLVMLSSHSSLIIVGVLLGKMASCYNSLKIFIPRNSIKTFIIPRRPRRRAPPFLLFRFVSESRKREMRMFLCSQVEGGVHLPKTSSVKGSVSAEASNKFLNSDSQPSSPPESVFVRLTPNRQRYSFRDEL